MERKWSFNGTIRGHSVLWLAITKAAVDFGIGNNHGYLLWLILGVWDTLHCRPENQIMPSRSISSNRLDLDHTQLGAAITS